MEIEICTEYSLSQLLVQIHQPHLGSKHSQTPPLLLILQWPIIPCPVSISASASVLPQESGTKDFQSIPKEVFSFLDKEGTLRDGESFPSILPNCLRRTPNSYNKPTLEPGLRIWGRVLSEISTGSISGALCLSLETFLLTTAFTFSCVARDLLGKGVFLKLSK